LQGIDGLYCVGDSCFPGQGVIAVAFSGVMCAHRVAADIGKIEHSFSFPIIANGPSNSGKPLHNASNAKVLTISKFLLTLYT